MTSGPPLRVSPSLYPWPELVAEGRELVAGVDYSCSDRSLVTAARAWAGRRGLRATIRTTARGVWVGFRQPAEGPHVVTVEG